MKLKKIPVVVSALNRIPETQSISLPRVIDINSDYNTYY